MVHVESAMSFNFYRKNGLGGSSCTESHRSLYNSKGSIYSSTATTGGCDVINGWTTVENFTALHVASHAGHADLVEMLLSKYHASTFVKLMIFLFLNIVTRTTTLEQWFPLETRKTESNTI